MYRWFCSPRSRETHKRAALPAERQREPRIKSRGNGLHVRRRPALRARHWLVLGVAFLALRGVGVEAQAATGEGVIADPARVDPLLGSLSFTSSDEPVEVTATSLEFDYRERILTYRGNVVARQGDVELSADSLTLALAQGESTELRSVVAQGNVRFAKGDRRASAGRAEFDQAKRLIILHDNAVLEDDRGNVSGDSVHVYLDEGRTVIDGGAGRVRAVLRPSEDSGGPSAAVQED